MSTQDSNRDAIAYINSFFLKTVLLVCLSGTSGQDYNNTDQIVNLDISEIPLLILKFPTITNLISKWIYNDESCVDKKNGNTLYIPPLVIETILNIKDIGPNQWVKLKDDDGNSWNVCKGNKKSSIVLARWLIELDNSSQTFKSYDSSNEEIFNNTNLEKQMALLFRYLNTLLTLLPTNDLHNSINYQNSKNLEIDYKVFDGSQPILSKGRIGLSKPIINTYQNIMNKSNISKHLEQRKITPVWTKFGLLRVSVSYRHDCNFEVTPPLNNDIICNTSNDNVSNDLSNDHHHNSNIDRYNMGLAVSISPHNKMIPIKNFSYDQNSFQRKDLSGTKIVQPFKTGSMGSPQLNVSQNFHYQTPMLNNMNNISSSIIYSTLRSQNGRANSISTIASNQNLINNQQNIDNISYNNNTTSKYSSSFGKLRRHSSIKTNQAFEKPIRFSTDITAGTRNPSNEMAAPGGKNPSNDIIDFVKFLDEKPELKLTNDVSTTKHVDNLTSSISKFRKLKVGNDLLSENLSMSISLDGNAHSHSKSRSNSRSPIPSISPNIQFPSIPSKVFDDDDDDDDDSLPLQNTDKNVNINAKGRTISFDKQNYTVHNKISEILKGQYNMTKQAPGGANSKEDEGYDDNNEILYNNSKFSENAMKDSPSIYSIDSFSESFSKSKFPFQKLSNLSYPTAALVPAYGKIHRPSLRSTDVLAKPGQSDLSDSNVDQNENANCINERESIKSNENQDTDMVFFMSESHIPEQ